MINVKIYRNKSGEIYGFDASNHGDKIVCAAVSILVMNTVNSIESFTEAKGICAYNDDSEHGYLNFSIESIKSDISNKNANLLLNSLLLGLNSIQEEYGKHLKIID
jgi:uncharacterized protein